VKRYIAGLNRATTQAEEGLPDGVFLARVERLQYRWHKYKPHYVVLFSVVEPKSCSGNRFGAYLDCSPRALWRLNWFLRDFGYDEELLSRNEIDDRHLVGLRGVVKVRRQVVNGTSLLLLDGFAPQQEWSALAEEVEQRISTKVEP
jgi:hypothetical protein